MSDSVARVYHKDDATLPGAGSDFFSSHEA